MASAVLAQRNGFGDTIRHANPDSGVTDSVYDARGLVTQITDARGVVTNFSYDAAGRLTARSFPAASGEDVVYSYDDTTGGNEGVGRITQIDDETGSLARVYDARGNITAETRSIAGYAHAIGYAYDLADRVATTIYPSGREVSLTRDAQGRITAVTTREDALATPVTLASSIVWMPPVSAVAGWGRDLCRSDRFPWNSQAGTRIKFRRWSRAWISATA